MNKENVCAVVVTYNRKEFLIECLEGLLKQTRPLNGIYIIDNASTDSTPELLKEKGFIQELPPEKLNEPWEREFKKDNLSIYYVRMHENTGGAGGFYEGVKRTYEEGYDWLWLMDDDVEPMRNALEELLKFEHISKCIHPRKKYIDGTYFNWEGYIDIKTGLRRSFNDISFENGKSFCCVNFACFEGMLIHRDIIDKIGYPDKKYFIIYDDTIYGLKASLFTNVIYIKDAIFIKKINKEKEPLSDMSIYYMMRNYFHRLDDIENTYNVKTTKYITIFLVFLGFFIYILRHKKINSLKILFKGFFDGIFRKKYKTFL